MEWEPCLLWAADRRETDKPLLSPLELSMQRGHQPGCLSLQEAPLLPQLRVRHLSHQLFSAWCGSRV